MSFSENVTVRGGADFGVGSLKGLEVLRYVVGGGERARFIGRATRILSDPSTGMLQVMDRICGVQPTPRGEVTGARYRGGPWASASCSSVSAVFCDNVFHFFRISNTFHTAKTS